MFTVILIFLLGLAVGSFLNVLIFRAPRGEDFFGRSYCDYCGRTLKGWDLIPVLSYTNLRGKCRFCKQRIDWHIPAVEIITALFFVAVFLKFPVLTDPKLWFYLFFTSSLIVIFFTDLKNGVIPDKIIFPALIISLLFVVLSGVNSVNHILSGIGAFVFFSLLSFATGGRGMGGGDIKLALLLGLVLGFPKFLMAFYLAFLTGAIVGLILVLWGKKRLKKDTIAFGPFLVLGGLIAIFFGNQMVLLLSNFW